MSTCDVEARRLVNPSHRLSARTRTHGEARP